MFLAALALQFQPIPYPVTPVYFPEQEITAIRKIVCGGRWQGTATVIAPGILMSVNHVTSPGTCVDEESGKIAKVYLQDADKDFSLLFMDTTGIMPIKYTCSKFKTGQAYYSYGYGRGKYQIRTQIAKDYYSTDEQLQDGAKFPGMRFLIGSLEHGMSGGPIISSSGYIYGLNNISNGWSRSFSRELADTPLCKKP